MVAQHRPRFLLMAVAGVSLLAALWAGLLRLGWGLPPLGQSLPSSHGPLMIVGFLGTLIGLERAVALERRWPYGVPLLAGSGALASLFGLPLRIGHILSAAGSIFFISIFVFLLRRQPTAFLATMGLGAVAWFVGNLLWLAGYPLHQVVPWWAGFLVLTIAGERLELSRLMRLSFLGREGFLLASGLFSLGLVVALYASDIGIGLSGMGLFALALWLLRYDIAWRNIRQGGLSRFMAFCLLTGYIWLGFGGLLWIFFPHLFSGGPYYDAMLHSIFLGFVFSMIFGHAPIIFPSVTGVAMLFQEAFYGHLALLHLSLLVRVGGDLLMSMPTQRWGGLLNVLAVFLFLVNNVHAMRAARIEGKKSA